jgi:hypothetical protein
VAGNRALRDEQAYQRWKSQRVEELLQAMEQVCKQHTIGVYYTTTC